MKYATIKMTLYYKDHESLRNVTIHLDKGEEKIQLEDFIIGFRNVLKFLNDDFLYLLVESVDIEYVEKEKFDIKDLDI